MAAPILIIGIGNEARGDDAIAPLLLRELEVSLATQAQRDQVELIEEFQLQIEHAMDLLERELVLFVDSGMDTPAPFFFSRAQPGDSSTLFSHALAPDAVLATYRQIFQAAPPPAFMLCVRGEQFELGAPLSAEAQARMELASRFMQELLRNADLSAWEEYCLGGSIDPA